jgi:integrase
MPKLTVGRYPSYRLHKQSGQAVVTLNGHDQLLGEYDTEASRAKYDRIIAEWLASGRTSARGAILDSDGLLVSELILRFMAHAQTHYRLPGGYHSLEINNFRDAFKPLNRLYGSTLAIQFGPLALKAVRVAMIRLGWCRNVVNRQTSRVRQMFRWASENELLPASVWHGLQAVPGLRRGRSDARETEPVRPVPDAIIDATLRWLSPHVRTMVQLQRLTGMRPGELCQLRGGEIDRSRSVWRYTPPKHKTLHHGHVRTIYLGPRAQQIIQPYLDALPSKDMHVFSPARSEAQRHAEQRQAIKSKVTRSRAKLNKSAAKRKRRRAPGDVYDVRGYRRAIARACERADRWEKGAKVIGNDETLIPAWHPHQMRHTASTEWRRLYGPDAALTLLGDRTTRMIDVYAEKDHRTAERIAAEVG